MPQSHSHTMAHTVTHEIAENVLSHHLQPVGHGEIDKGYQDVTHKLLVVWRELRAKESVVFLTYWRSWGQM